MIRAILILSSLILLICGCSSVVNPSFSTNKAGSERSLVDIQGSNLVIFVPGFKGSELISESSKNTVWVTLRQATIGRKTLTLPDPYGIFDVTDTYVPGQVLDTVSIIPGLFDFDAYGKTLDGLNKLCRRECKLIAMSYDWRKDLMDPVRNLASLVKRARANGAKKITLIGHSMGGLIVAYYLRYGSQDLENADESWLGAKSVDGVIFAGVPFRGALTTFHDLEHGIPTGFNRTLINPLAMSSFGSSYYLLPPQEETVLVDINGRDILYNPIHHNEFYKLHGWGVFNHSSSSPEINNDATTFLDTALDRASIFYTLLNRPLNLDNVTGDKPCINIVGENHKTLHRAVRLDSDYDLVFRARDLPLWAGDRVERSMYTEGDSIVTATSAILPFPFRDYLNCDYVKSANSHGQLLIGTVAHDVLAKLITPDMVKSTGANY